MTMRIAPSLLALWLLQVTTDAASSEAVCGQLKTNSTHILGGQPASNGSWPWQVNIFQGGYPICGGSLITDEWVLSAAHCFRSTASYDYTLILGVHELSNHTNAMVASNVQKIILHPDYSGKAASSGDIALLKLLAPVNFTEYVLPICLPNSFVQFSLQADCWVSGWIDTQGGEPLPNPFTIQELKVPLISRGTCNNLYNTDANATLAKDPIKPDKICTGYPENGKDSYLPDSGGPLVCKLNGSWTQAGVMSWGIPQHPGVYTSVPSYTKWIYETMASKNWGDGNNAPIATIFLMSLTVVLL